MKKAQVTESAKPDTVMILLQAVSDSLEKRCDRFLTAQYSLTTPQYLVLLAVWQGGDTTLGGLSEQLRCSRGNITGIVDRLERDGWLVRERSQEDRRVITVFLTDKGKAVVEIRKGVEKELNRLAEVWNEEERQSLNAVLGRLYRELEDS